MRLDIKDKRLLETLPVRNRLAALRAAYPLSPATGQPADKAFFDELSGEPLADAASPESDTGDGSV